MLAVYLAALLALAQAPQPAADRRAAATTFRLAAEAAAQEKEIDSRGHALGSLALAEAKAGFRSEAREHLAAARAAFASDGKSHEYFLEPLAEANAELGDFDEALRMLALVPKDLPDFATGQVMARLVKAGRKADALRLAEGLANRGRGKKSEFDFDTHVSNLAVAARDIALAGLPEAAEPLFAEAVQKARVDPKGPAGVADDLADIARQQIFPNDKPAAIKLLREARRLADDLPDKERCDLLDIIGSLLSEAGDEAGARSALVAALEIARKLPAAATSTWDPRDSSLSIISQSLIELDPALAVEAARLISRPYDRCRSLLKVAAGKKNTQPLPVQVAILDDALKSAEAVTPIHARLSFSAEAAGRLCAAGEERRGSSLIEQCPCLGAARRVAIRARRCIALRGRRARARRAQACRA